MNFLKNLELQGFKSFAQKTVFHFPDRITAVVGPNGSGKSNIIDAIRWVLGEREAKNLRGSNLSNLIFAGSTKKAPLSFARVSLCFDNKDKVFSFDGEEVEVSRRVDKSGTSKFFIYDKEVRMRDLAPFLSRARIGAKGLTIIGQGQSDIFIKSRPQDRRIMIEEILGLKEFRIKKTQAESRLQSSNNNLEKVKVTLEEIEPRLRSLRKQKKRWERRFEIEGQLKSLENLYFSIRYLKAKKEVAMANPDISSLEKKREEVDKKVSLLEKEVEKISVGKSDEDEIKKLRQIKGELSVKKSNLDREIVRLETRMEFEDSEKPKGVSIEGMTIKIKELLRDLDQMLRFEDISQLREGIELVKGKLEGLVFSEKPKEGQNSIQKEIEKLKHDIDEYEIKIKENEEKEEVFLEEERKANREFREKVTKLEAQKNELRDIERGIQEKTLNLQKQQLYVEELEREWQAIGRDIKDLKELKEQEGSDGENLLDIERKMNRLRNELFSIGEIEESVVEEAKEVEEKHDFLRREFDDLVKAKADLEKLISDLEKRIHNEFRESFKIINHEFNNYFRLMFKGGKAKLKIEKIEVEATEVERDDFEEEETGEERNNEDKKRVEFDAGVEIELNLPNKKSTSLDMLSGGERSLVSIAALFSFIAVNPPPFLVLDEIDAALDEDNASRFAKLVEDFSSKTQFIIVTHNRATMEVAQTLYGVTMEDSGISKVLSLKLDNN